MSEQLEIEFKNLVTKDEMDLLIHHFGLTTNDFFEQVNVYFDSKTCDLKQSDCALRVRIKDHNYELTLKEPAPIGLLETNQMISKAEYLLLQTNNRLPDGPVRARIQRLLEYVPLVYEIAELSTKRATFSYKGQLLFLDQSTYYNHSDYEIELETTNYDEGRQVFDHLLKQFNLSNQPVKSKIYRAYDYKQAKKKD